MLKLYSAIDVPTLLYSSEVWSLTNNDCKRIQAAENENFRWVVGCILRGQESTENIFNKTKNKVGYRATMKEHLNRQQVDIIAINAWQYTVTCRRECTVRSGTPKNKMDTTSRNWHSHCQIL